MFFGNLGSAGFIKSQGWALCVQMSIVGTHQLGSSRLPTVMTMICEGTPPRANSGEPQSAQNSRFDLFPLSAVVTCCLGVPRIRRSESVVTTATVECPVPLARWQSRQWQLSTAMGAAEPS